MENLILDHLKDSNNLPQIGQGEGREKTLHLYESPNGKYVIQEYKKPLSAPILKATVIQQQILHLLIPERYVVNILESGFKNGKPIIVTDFIELDKSKTPDLSNPTFFIPYARDIKQTEEFKNLIPDLRTLGLIPEDEPEKGQVYTNEQASNTVFNLSGSQVVVDIQSPIIDINGKRRPALLKQGVLEIAKRKNLLDQIIPFIQEYEQAFTQIDTSSPPNY